MAVSSTLGPPKLHVSGPHRSNRAQENAASEPAMDVDDEVGPLLPLPEEKEESHLWRDTMGYRVPS